MSAPTPDLLYLLGTDAATSLTNHGSDTGAPPPTFVNYAVSNIADAVSYASNFATIGSANSLDTKFAPNSSFAVALMIRIVPTGVTLQPFWGVKKISPAVGYSLAFARADVGPALWDAGVSTGAGALPEFGWCPIAMIFAAPTTTTYVHQGRTNRRMFQTYTTINDITTNDATGKVIFGGASWASGYSNVQVAECSVFKTAPSADAMREYLETMRARSVARGIPVY